VLEVGVYDSPTVTRRVVGVFCAFSRLASVIEVNVRAKNCMAAVVLRLLYEEAFYVV
jgi:hypothetical protein